MKELYNITLWLPLLPSYHSNEVSIIIRKLYSRSTLDQSRGRKTDGGTRRSQRSGEEEATLVTVDQPFRHRTNQNQHPESGCWISLVHI